MMARINEHGFTADEMALIATDLMIQSKRELVAELRDAGMRVPMALRSEITDLCARYGELLARRDGTAA